MEDIIKANAEKGFIHLGSGEDWSLYRKVDNNGIDIYYLDEGYDCGALTVWTSMRGPDITDIISKDLRRVR